MIYPNGQSVLVSICLHLNAEWPKQCPARRVAERLMRVVTE